MPNSTPIAGLPPGLTEEQVKEAIRSSGYPLQIDVARALRLFLVESGIGHWHVHEEWHFKDSRTGVSRTLDALVELAPIEWNLALSPQLRPHLTLLVECKQSNLPYVFFATENASRAHRFPVLAGLAHPQLSIATDDDPSKWALDVLDALGMSSHPFVTAPPHTCATFSKCVRKGRKLELSGAAPFRSVVAPLMSAAHHYVAVHQPVPTAAHFDCRFVVPLVVIDGPLLVATNVMGEEGLSTAQWIRVVRHHSPDGRHWEHDRDVFALDVVHRTFLEEYLKTHAMPFAVELAHRVEKHALVLASGKGFVKGMGSQWHREIESRLAPQRHIAIANKSLTWLERLLARARR